LTGIANTTGWLFVTQERADDMFRWGMIGSSLTVLAIVIGVPWGPVGVARSYSVMMVTVVVPLLFWFVSRKGPVKQKDFYSVLTPVALPSVAVLAVVHAFRQWAPVDPLSAILLAAPLAAATFFGMLIAFPRGRAVLQDVVQLGYLFMGWGSTNRPEPSVSLTVRA
jgi:PST family polysaccharide transporter